MFVTDDCSDVGPYLVNGYGGFWQIADTVNAPELVFEPQPVVIANNFLVVFDAHSKFTLSLPSISLSPGTCKIK